MDVSDYRKHYAAQLEQAAEQRTSFRDLLAESTSAEKRRPALGDAAGAGDDGDLVAALVVLGDKDQDVQLRVSALRAIGMDIDERPELIDRLLDLVRDDTEPAALRKAALTLLQQISFRMVAFPGKRPAYLAALRSIVDDKDAELRQRVIGILAREKDEYVQRLLLEGLEHRSKALVSPAKAIQFLGYDVHAEYFPLLRQIVERPPSRAAKGEAVRLLAADPSSKDLLTEILTDKSESPEVRSVSAIALQSLDPDRFEEQARRIVLDVDEDEQLRATSLSALTLFANPAASAEDAVFTRRVEELRETSASPQLKRATTSYVAKHGA